MPSRFFRLPVFEIGYVRMIVEGYDGLAAVRSHGGARGEIEWLVGEGLEAEADELAERLAVEVGLIAIDRPADWPSLSPAEQCPEPLRKAAPASPPQSPCATATPKTGERN